jgi:hypothetical protein
MLRVENASFFRVFGVPGALSGGRAEKISAPSSKRVKYAVSLAAFKSVAITAFAFPFNNILRTREALKLQTLPYAAAGKAELFPVVIKKTPRTCSGVALHIPVTELENFHAPQPQTENIVWPAPLPLAAKVGGEGVTFWLDEDNICSMLWRGGIPVFYRWKSRADATVETERAWYGRYCKSKEEEVGEVFVLDATNPSELAGFQDIAKESAALFPWIGGVNMSRRALDSAVVLERTVQSLSRAAFWVLMMGLFILTGNGLRYHDARRSGDLLRARTVELYRSVFEPARTGPISDPIGLAHFHVQQLRGGFSEGRSISEMFSDLGDIFEQNPGLILTLDVARYNSDGVDYTGTAPDMETVQEFRRAWAERAASAQIGNLSIIPGGSGYRFDLSVRW